MTEQNEAIQWREVAKLDQLQAACKLSVTVDDHEILLVLEDDNKVYAVDGKCPHAGAPLVKGRICDGHITCPWHMASFRIYDGAWLQPPALRGLQTYAVKVDNNTILIDLKARPSGHEYLYAGDGITTVAVIGAGAAGAATCTALRDFGYDREIIVIDPQTEEPIDRTLLSKNALSGKASLDKLPLWDEKAKERLRLNRIVDSVTQIDPSGKFLLTQSGQKIVFDAAVIATGSRPQMPLWPGNDLEGCFTLRDQASLERLLKERQPGRHVLIAGASFIAMEAASALLEAGLHVTVVGRGNAPFEKQFGPEVAAAIRKLHESKGVRFEMNAEIVALLGNGHIESATLSNGKELACDIVLIGYGVQLNTEAFGNLPQAPHGAILVDAYLQAAPDVYVAGDIAAIKQQSGEPQRIEHWRVAEQHGYLAAKNILGKREQATGAPFFWSQQQGKRLTYVGHAASWDSIEIDGDLEQFNVVVWYLKDDHVVAGFACQQELATATLVERLHENLNLTEFREAITTCGKKTAA